MLISKVKNKKKTKTKHDDNDGSESEPTDPAATARFMPANVGLLRPLVTAPWKSGSQETWPPLQGRSFHPHTFERLVGLPYARF
jgi:hypothetical protein